MMSETERPSDNAPNPLAGDTATGKYPMPEEQWARIDRDYTYHPPKGDQPERYLFLREAARNLFVHICTNTPPNCRDQSLALTHLETVVFYANAAIARYE